MIEEITSITNPLIKMAASLKQKKYRSELGLFVIEGIRFAEEAVTSGWETEYCLYTKDAAQHDRVKRVLSALRERNCRQHQVSHSVYERISDTEHPQGILVIIKKKWHDLSELLVSGQEPFFIVLDRVQDPGNVGTMIRTADAAGCSGVILTDGCADLFSGKVLRSSMGSVFHLPIIDAVKMDFVRSFFVEHNISVLVTCLDTPLFHWDVAMTGPLAIVFGNEGSGVSQEWLAVADKKAKIPIYGKAESLNVASATAIFLYEAARQRRSCL
ncbi:MAG: tRNA/rRNA methyltransferase (SpoU) [Firmicutes bacterium]|nr:tRNA/rRNA methyltransferase (SpoU) [Bacillota bacterium]